MKKYVVLLLSLLFCHSYADVQLLMDIASPLLICRIAVWAWKTRKSSHEQVDSIKKFSNRVNTLQSVVAVLRTKNIEEVQLFVKEAESFIGIVAEVYETAFRIFSPQEMLNFIEQHLSDWNASLPELEEKAQLFIEVYMNRNYSEVCSELRQHTDYRIEKKLQKEIFKRGINFWA